MPAVDPAMLAAARRDRDEHEKTCPESEGSITDEGVSAPMVESGDRHGCSAAESIPLIP